jgi:hypothetical protein
MADRLRSNLDHPIDDDDVDVQMNRRLLTSQGMFLSLTDLPFPRSLIPLRLCMMTI